MTKGLRRPGLKDGGRQRRHGQQVEVALLPTGKTPRGPPLHPPGGQPALRFQASLDG